MKVKIKKEEFSENPIKDRIVTYFRDGFGEWMIPLSDVMEDLNMAYSTAYKYVNQLVDNGMLGRKAQQNKHNNGKTIYYFYMNKKIVSDRRQQK